MGNYACDLSIYTYLRIYYEIDDILFYSQSFLKLKDFLINKSQNKMLPF